MRAPELLEQPLAVERLHLRAVGLDDVAGESPGARLRDRTLHDLLAGRPPELGLDAVLLLEGGGQRHRVLRVERRVDGDDAFLARAREDAALPIAGLQHVEGAMRRSPAAAPARAPTRGRGEQRRERHDGIARRSDSTFRSCPPIRRLTRAYVSARAQPGRAGTLRRSPRSAPPPGRTRARSRAAPDRSARTP